MLKLNLIVIRTQNLAETVRWYQEIFDLHFLQEKHSDGVLHYSAILSEGVIEIYPTNKSALQITFGFAVNKEDFENIVSRINYKTIEENLILLKDLNGNSIILSLEE